MTTSLDSITASAMFNAAQKATPNVVTKNAEQAREAANEFEAMFVKQMVEQMWSGIETDGPFGGGNAEKIFRSMLNDEYSGEIVNGGGIGISDNIYGEILKMQETGQK
jgi:Rod binding domain-containing protein